MMLTNFSEDVDDRAVRDLFSSLSMRVQRIERLDDAYNTDSQPVVLACFATPAEAHRAAHSLQGLRAMGAADVEAYHLEVDPILPPKQLQQRPITTWQHSAAAPLVSRT